MAHFAKRELETVLCVGQFLGRGPADSVLFLFSVHRFSHATMPRRNIFKKYEFYCLELTRWLTLVQLLSLSCSLGYFLSRLLRTSQTGPSSTGLLLAYPIYGPTYAANSAYITGTFRSNQLFIWACAGIWLVRVFLSILVQTHVQPVLQFAELSNLSTHLTLRNLRPPGSKKRAIPHGYGFGLLSCPNYFFESVAWAAVAYMTGSWAGASHFLAFCLGC